jgi:hypothetical protein
MVKVVRSPNYPIISLKEAVARVKRIYDSEHMHSTPREALAKALGYGGLNGASGGVLSALVKYGLLTKGVGEEFKVSADAQTILIHAEGDEERAEAIQRAAFRPTLFQELHDTYGDDLPSENTLSIYLQKRNFNPKVVMNVIGLYRDTIDFVKTELSALDDDLPEQQESSPMMASTDPSLRAAPLSGRPGASSPSLSTGVTNPFINVPQQPAGDLTLTLKLAEDATVRAEFFGHITQEAISKFIKLLEVSLDTFPKKQAPVQQDLFAEDLDE